MSAGSFLRPAAEATLGLRAAPCPLDFRIQSSWRRCDRRVVILHDEPALAALHHDEGPNLFLRALPDSVGPRVRAHSAGNRQRPPHRRTRSRIAISSGVSVVPFRKVVWTSRTVFSVASKPRSMPPMDRCGTNRRREIDRFHEPLVKSHVDACTTWRSAASSSAANAKKARHFETMMAFILLLRPAVEAAARYLLGRCPPLPLPRSIRLQSSEAAVCPCAAAPCQAAHCSPRATNFRSSFASPDTIVSASLP